MIFTVFLKLGTQTSDNDQLRTTVDNIPTQQA